MWFSLESTHSVSDPDMIDLDSQPVRVLLSSPTTLFLTLQNLFGPSGCAWSALKHTGSVSDPDVVNLDSQIVRSLLSNLLVRFLTRKWFILTLSPCVVCSQVYSHNV